MIDLPTLLSHIAALEAELARAEERALAYFRVAQRSTEITPDDVAWAEYVASAIRARKDHP